MPHPCGFFYRKGGKPQSSTSPLSTPQQSRVPHPPPFSWRRVGSHKPKRSHSQPTNKRGRPVLAPFFRRKVRKHKSHCERIASGCPTAGGCPHRSDPPTCQLANPARAGANSLLLTEDSSPPSSIRRTGAPGPAFGTWVTTNPMRADSERLPHRLWLQRITRCQRIIELVRTTEPYCPMSLDSEHPRNSALGC